MDRSAQNELTLYQKNLSESHSETLSSDEKEKPRFESLKKNSGEEEKERNAEKKEDLTRFVNHWNAICTECNEPTLAWLPSDVDRFAVRLVEVIRHLRIAVMSDEELCGKQSRPIFERMGAAFSEFNPHGLVITTFAKFGPQVWRAVEAKVSERVHNPTSGQALCVKREKPLILEEEARELERLTEAWNKACDERGRPTAQWSREAVDQCAVSLLPVIIATRMRKIPDQEVVSRLDNVVDCLATKGPVDNLAAFTLNHFVHNRIPFGWEP